MFRTELTIAPATGQLPRTARVLTLGSCFADSIGSRLTANKVETLANPFGTVFQPLAQARLLRAAAGEEVDWQQHVVEARGRWQSYDLHGSIGAASPVELLQTIQELVRRTGEFLRQADVVLLTLGTAWAYRLRETGELVNNCHKQSADLFVRELLTPDEIINALAETHAYLRRVNPELRFVVTVSPVRHLKDTLQLNAVSKSVLRLATHIVSDLLPGVAYFPAYELLMDDLRDYRFYAADMLHPSEVAEDYVWEKFARAYFDADFGRFRKEWAAIRQSLEHRPLHAGAPEHRHFLESTREKLEQLSLRKVDVADELHTVRAQLAALPLPRVPEPVAAEEDDEERIDIGQESAITSTEESVQVEATPAPLTESRLPRLSPEEFRAQRAVRSGRPERGRRDGRGKGQQPAPTENEQFQTAAAAANGQPEQQAQAIDALELAPALVASIRPAELTAALVALDSDAANEGEELVKKKKRRSRGGAKRTARKNALRLAAGELLPTPDSGDMAPAITEAGNSPVLNASEDAVGLRTEDRKSSVITKSVPVKRGGRNNEPGRVPRVALFAEMPNAASAELPVTDAADAPMMAPVEAPAVAGIPTAEATIIAPNSRNSRNRGKKGGAKTIPSIPDSSANVAAAQLAEIPVATVAGGHNERFEAILPTAEGATVTPMDTEATGAVPAPTGGRRNSRPRRAISAGRAVKPDIDTPVIPVSDDLSARTQVAAGRMMGSSASLIAPTATPKKAITVKKLVVSKQVAAPKPALVPAQSVAPKPVVVPKQVAKPKAKAAKVVPVTVAAPVVTAVVESVPPAPLPATKSKPVPKPKPTPAVAKATPATPPATKAPAKSTAKPAAKPKTPTSKVVAPKPAAKPKAPRKPNKPA